MNWLANKIEQWPTAKLLPYARNARTHSEEQVAQIAGRLQTSTLRRRVNQRDWFDASVELARWIYGGGKVLPGLVARRAAEAALLSGRTAV